MNRLLSLRTSGNERNVGCRRKSDHIYANKWAWLLSLDTEGARYRFAAASSHPLRVVFDGKSAGCHSRHVHLLRVRVFVLGEGSCETAQELWIALAASR